MEWATRIDTTNRGLGVHIMSVSGVRTEGLSALVSGGLPRLRKARKVIEQQIGTWRAADSNDYLAAFEMKGCNAERNMHSVYETRSGHTRILVPALVLMRAFFRPTQYLLPEMFLPQALDRVRFLDLSGPTPQVEFLRPTWRNLRDRYGDVRTPIAWMSSFPSAIAFAASVHRHALEGRIAVTLPRAQVKLALHGCLEQSTFFVTNADLLHVQATEPPLDWATGQSRHVFRRATHVTAGPIPVLKVDDLPFRPNGVVDVSDHEWQLVESILLPPVNVRRSTRLDPRLVFDGILRKLVLGTPWRRTPYVVGTATNALFAYRRWHRSGALEAALDVLRRCRSRMAA